LTQADHDSIYRRCNPERNDVLLVNIGAGVATSALVIVDFEFSLKNVALLKPNLSRTIGAYLNYSVASRKRRIVQDLSSGGAQPFLSLQQICELTIPLPPSVSEQRAIATALSDVDEFVNELDKLVTKKHDVKQGAMQELLAGKTRLPGFSGEWKETTLGNIANFSKGSGLSKSVLNDDGHYKCILYGELFTTYNNPINKVHSGTNSLDGVLSKIGDILIPGSTTTTGIDLAKACALMNNNIALGGDINIIRPHSAKIVNSIFLADYLTEIKKHEIALNTQGITIIHLYGRDLVNLKLNLPPLDEQTAIATILSDMDTEISALEQRRDKLIDLKQGMMQQLLTGRIRLVEAKA